jgi:hypothetical protein
MPQFIYDQLNSFGKADLASDAAFPNTIDLEDADISRMTVDLKLAGEAAAGGTGITVSVAGASDAGFTTPETLGTRTITLDDINKGAGKIAVSPNRYRFVKVTFTKTGTFTAGVVEAFVNSYLGK